MISPCLKILISFSVVNFCIVFNFAQPVLSTVKKVDDWTLLSDFKDSLLFYYLPSPPSLLMDLEGKPRFQMTSLRYTGTQTTGGDIKSFLNILEFSLGINTPSIETINSIIEKLPLGSKLQAIPIESSEISIIIPASLNTKEKKIGNTTKSISDAHGIWTEKSFSIKLQNHEAQLVMSQIQDNVLILSVHFSHLSQVIILPRKQVLTADSSTLKNSGLDEFNSYDTTVSLQSILSDAIPISIDVNKFPDFIKKIDLNEGLPSAYATTEIRCHDFKMNLRPDLAQKRIDIKATVVTGEEYVAPSILFSTGEPNKTFVHQQFYFPVSLSKPLQYKVTEISKNGDIIFSTPWKLKENWYDILDITSSAQQLNKENRILEIELAFGDSLFNQFSLVGAEIEYTFNKKTIVERIPFNKSGIQSYMIYSDKATPPQISTILVYRNLKIVRNKKKITKDNYYFYEIKKML